MVFLLLGGTVGLPVVVWPVIDALHSYLHVLSHDFVCHSGLRIAGRFRDDGVERLLPETMLAVHAGQGLKWKYIGPGTADTGGPLFCYHAHRPVGTETKFFHCA